MSLQDKLDAILTAVMEARAWIAIGTPGEFTEIKIYCRFNEYVAPAIKTIPKGQDCSPAEIGTWIMNTLKQNDYTNVSVKNILVRHSEDIELLKL